MTQDGTKEQSNPTENQARADIEKWVSNMTYPQIMWLWGFIGAMVRE